MQHPVALNLNVSPWAALVVALASTLIALSLVVSCNVLTRSAPGELPSAFIAVLVVLGVTILWGPMILLIAIPVVCVFGPASLHFLRSGGELVRRGGEAVHTRSGNLQAG